MVSTCVSCCVQQAQPFRVLGRSVPAESLRSAQRPRKDTAYTSLLGSVAGQSAGTAASPSIPGFILGCRLFRYNYATAPSPLHSHHPTIRCVSCSSRPKGRSSAFSVICNMLLPVFLQSKFPVLFLYGILPRSSSFVFFL